MQNNVARRSINFCGLAFALVASVVIPDRAAIAASTPDFARDVAPIFRKYCLGCHNSQEAQGGLVLESHAQALHGGEHGAIVVAGNAEKSRLILVLEKRIEPAMPPEGNKGPSKDEISVLKAWIQAARTGQKQARQRRPKLSHQKSSQSANHEIPLRRSRILPMDDGWPSRGTDRSKSDPPPRPTPIG